MAVPETAVLPITPYPKGVSERRHALSSETEGRLYRTACGLPKPAWFRGGLRPHLNHRWRRSNGPESSPCPRAPVDSNSGGEMREPVTATRTGPNASRGLSPSPSMSAPRRALSIDSVVHCPSDSSASCAARTTSLPASSRASSSGIVTSSTNRKRVIAGASVRSAIRSWMSGTTGARSAAVTSTPSAA